MCQEQQTPADVQETALAELDKNILLILLKDRSTGKNILWATDDYKDLGIGFAADDEITLPAITGAHGNLIKPRALKSKEEQGARTRNMAEVFTPLWICNKQNNLADNAWFGRENVFNTENGTDWQATEGKIAFPSEDGAEGWRAYIGSKRLEITCGEAPYLASRYDTMTGEIMPLEKRIGLLDRKLRVINERTRNLKDRERAKKRWLELATLAVRSTYGFEWAGDNILLARENLLFTVADYYAAKFGDALDMEMLEHFAEIISWNIWQMDGLKAVVPNSCHDYKKERQAVTPNLFAAKDFSARTLKRSVSPCDVDEDERQKCQGCLKDNIDLHNGVYCRIKNWSTGKVLLFKDMLDGEGSEDVMSKDFKFDVVIGNPPYQDRTIGENRTYQPPVYHLFLDEAYKLSDKVMLIHPARFLFNAGSTPKEWNQKMLHDKHFSIVMYEADCSKIFPNTEIKGGIVISYHDNTKDFGEIDVFTIYPELNSLMKKVIHRADFSSISEIISGRSMYRFTKKMHDKVPDAAQRLSRGHENDLTSNVFEKLPDVMTESLPDDTSEYYRILGRINNERAYRFVKKEYIVDNKYIPKYKLFMPQSSGNGGLGETMAPSVVGLPGEATTDTFLSVGLFDTEIQAKNLYKYIKCKFTRT
ncbi:Eco57I restriction-modification methylase domain-containing protein, partial [Phascolarctobacterium succinatutens]